MKTSLNGANNHRRSVNDQLQRNHEASEPRTEPLTDCGQHRCVTHHGSLLILDEWLLYALKDTEAREVLEITEARYKKASTIFCSQFDVGGWHQKIGEPTLTDAICDRIVHDSYRLVIAERNPEVSVSMRQRKGLKSQQVQG